jgi:hypothetical protein
MRRMAHWGSRIAAIGVLNDQLAGMAAAEQGDQVIDISMGYVHNDT